MKEILSKSPLFVSGKQMMEARLSSILFLINGHFSGLFKPLMFQHRIFHIRFRDSEDIIIQNTDEVQIGSEITHTSTSTCSE